MGLLHSARLIAQRVGVDVSRYGLDLMHMLARQLDAHGVNVVLDVGANAGRYAQELRRAGYRQRIISFEPLSEPYSVLGHLSGNDPLWDAYPFALGDQEGMVTLNVAANAGESSSILPMLEAHVEAFPAASYIGTEQVHLRTVDSVAAELLRPADRIFLKADVQGYERSVLEGATATLANHCLGIQLELSFVPLYEGSMLYRDALDFVEAMGFSLTSIIPGATNLRNGRMLQADGIFFRES